MASSGAVEESLDFDFFETPRHQNENVQLISPTTKPPRGPDALESLEKQKASDNDKNTKSSASAKNRSQSLSASDSYSSDSGSEIDVGSSHNGKREKVVQSKNKSKSRRSLSNSSLSSTGSNSSERQSPSRCSQSLSRSRSDKDSSDKSKSGSSFSSDSDTDRPSNPVAKSPERSMPKRGRSRIGEDEYSSSAYSEGEENPNTKPSAQSKREDFRQENSTKKDKHKHAWDEKPMPNTKGNRRDLRVRPQTAKNPRASGSTCSTSASKSRGHRGLSTGSDSETLSDSDITDVSPMDSPRLQAGNSRVTNNRAKGGKGRGGRVSAAGDGDGDTAHKFMALPINGLDHANNDGGESEPPKYSRDSRDAAGLDLEILMKAVGELEKQKRVQANSRRVMFAPMGASREKNNYTFDQSKTRDIERENQRLLNEIVRRVNSTSDQKKQFYASPKPTYKLTPSAINRERDMKRIESENMAFLKRLQKVKPTTTICRDHQLKSYENTTLHGVSIAALHPLPGRQSRGASETGAGRRRSGASSVADSASSIGSRTRSMTSIHSGISSVRSSKRGSRPSSATVRPGSATKRIDTRPEWTDRW